MIKSVSHQFQHMVLNQVIKAIMHKLKWSGVGLSQCKLHLTFDSACVASPALSFRNWGSDLNTAVMPLKDEKLLLTGLLKGVLSSVWQYGGSITNLGPSIFMVW